MHLADILCVSHDLFAHAIDRNSSRLRPEDSIFFQVVELNVEFLRPTPILFGQSLARCVNCIDCLQFRDAFFL